MFSGGRDSTAAVVRLNERSMSQTLVTICSDHLVGINSVKKRLLELKRILPPQTEWRLIRQPRELMTDTSFYQKTCLPCHHGYVVVGAITAFALGAERLSFGYAGYQNTWPEQTPLAVETLSNTLAAYGITLDLPVYAVGSRSDVEAELIAAGLTPHALEQKCLQQVQNIELTPDVLAAQIHKWNSAIKASVALANLIEVHTVRIETLENFNG